MADQKEKDLIEAIIKLALDAQRISTRQALEKLNSLPQTSDVIKLRKQLLEADRKIELQCRYVLRVTRNIQKMTTQN